MTIDALRQELSESGILEDLHQNFMGLLDLTKSEQGHADLCQCSIVKNLVVHVL